MKLAYSLGLTVAIAVVAMCATITAHERKEVAGLEIVFGAEPEPALNGEKQFLRWRFLKDKQPFGDIEELVANVKRNGKTFGPFTGRMTPREPGVVATQHIFNNVGEYEVTLTFKKKGDATVHTVTFPFKIGDRKTLEIP
ncbi:MAG: hypothetical protein K2Y23_06565 [Cyanobacteria bacterium]|nr:hypothetical protein [Cyanobacteriota bacterium]